MTEKTEKEAPKTRLPGLPPLVAFVYAVFIFFMSMAYFNTILIKGFEMEADSAGPLAFFIGAFFAYIGNRGVRAMFKLRELSK